MTHRDIDMDRDVDAAPRWSHATGEQLVRVWAQPRPGDPNRTVLLTAQEARLLRIRLDDALADIEAEEGAHA